MSGIDRSDLGPAADGGQDLLDRLVHGYAVALAAVAVAEADRALAPVLLAGDQHVRHLGLAGGADLLRHAIVGAVHVDADAVLPQAIGDGVEVLDVLVTDRYADHLDRRQPDRERTRIVLHQDADEALDRAEQRA